MIWDALYLMRTKYDMKTWFLVYLFSYKTSDLLQGFGDGLGQGSHLDRLELLLHYTRSLNKLIVLRIEKSGKYLHKIKKIASNSKFFFPPSNQTNKN